MNLFAVLLQYFYDLLTCLICAILKQFNIYNCMAIEVVAKFISFEYRSIKIDRNKDLFSNKSTQIFCGNNK